MNTTVTTSSAPASGSTTGSLRFNGAGANTITLAGANVITSGGILVTSNVGNGLTTITGGTLEGASGADLVIFQNNTSSGLTIGSQINNNTSATRLTLSGPGLVTLTNGGNLFTGGIYLNGGTLNTATGGIDGASATNGITFNDGTLQASAGITTSKAITVGVNGGTIDLNGNAVTLGGNISGVVGEGVGAGLYGGFASTGVGLLTVNNTSGTAAVLQLGGATDAYYGGLTINGNSTVQDSGGSTGAFSTGYTTLGGSGTPTLDLDGHSATIAGIIGSGTNGVVTDSGAAGTLTLDGVASTSFSGKITGSLALTLNLNNPTASVTLLNAADSYNGATTLTSGSLNLGNGTATGAITASAITDNTILTIDNPTAMVDMGIIAGTGTLVQEGAGAVTFNSASAGINTFSGTLTDDGVVNLGTSAMAATILLNGTNANPATINYLSTAAGSLTGNITIMPGTAAVINNSGGGLLTLGTASTTIANGNNTVASTLNLTGTSGAINEGMFNVAGQITGANANSNLNVVDAIAKLSNANIYGGTTAVYGSGTLNGNDVLQMGAANALPSSTVVTLGNVASEGAGGGYKNVLDLNGYAQTILGLSSVNDNNGDDLNEIVNGNTDYSTPAGAAPATTTLTVTPTAGTTYTFSGLVGGGQTSNNFGVTLAGPGTQILTALNGPNIYTGGSVISSGTLIAGGTGAFGTGVVTLGNAATTTAGSSPTLLINGAYVESNPITVANQTTTGTYTIGGSNTTGTATYAGAVTLNNAAVLEAATGGTVDFSSVTPWTVNNNAALTIGSSGNAGTVELDGAITPAGGISLKAGTLVLDSAFTGGNLAVAPGTILTGNGSVAGTTGVTSATVNGSGLTLAGVTTFNSTGNLLSGAVTSTNGVTLANGAALTNNGVLTGNMTVGNGTLSGTGSVTGTTGVTGGTVNGSGLTLVGVTTFNGTGNTLSGTVTSTNGVTVATGAALANNGTLTGSMTVGNGTLSGTGSISGTTAVTGGTINGSGLTLSGLTTFNGPSNNLSGNVVASGGINLAAGATVTESGTQTGAVNLTAGATSLSGSGSIGAVTLNGGGNTLSGAGTLSTAGITVNGANNSISSGTVSGATTINTGGALYINSGAIASGMVNISGGGALGGVGSTGAVTVAGGGAINLQDGATGTLTVASLTVGNAGSPSSLSFDIQTVTGTTSVDKIQDNGTLNLNGTGGTVITIGALGGTNSLAAGNYTLIAYTGTLSGGLDDLQLATTSLDGATLTLVQGNGVIELNVNDAVSTTYNLAAQVANARIMQNVGTTTVSSTITNTGTGLADTLNYSGLGATPASGATTSGGALAAGASGSNTTQTFTAGAVTGDQTITPTVTTATNGTLGGNATLGNTTTATVDVVANRVVTATSVDLGRVLVGQAASGISTLSTTGDDSDFTRVTVGTAGPDANGVSATGGTNSTFNSAGVTDTRTVGGTFATAGNVSGTLTLVTTREGLSGEAPINVALAYTADPVNERTFTTSTDAINLGRFLATSTPLGSASVSSTGLNSMTATATLGSFAGTGTDGLTLNLANDGSSATFNGAASSQTANYAIGGTAGAAGTISGSFSSTPTDEFGNTLSNVTVTVTGDAVNQRTISNGAVTDLGTLHNGAIVSVTANAFSSTGANATTTSVMVAGGNGSADGNGVTLTGSSSSFTGATSGLVDGSTQTFGGTIAGAGTTTGTFNLAVTTLENGGAGLVGEGGYNNATVAYTANVYSGQGVWNTNGGGSWGMVSATPTNWTANGGTPGLDANFTTTDSATFGPVVTAGTAVVTLDGDNPSLNAITFNDATGGSYNISPGTGGMLKLNAGAGTASITNVNGGNQISAPLELDSNTVVSVQNGGDTLTLSGNISGATTSNLIIGGGNAGTVILTGANTFTGPTTLASGTLQLGSTDALVTSTEVTQMGGTIDLDGNRQTLQNFSSTGGTITSTGAGAPAVVTFDQGAASVNASNITGNVAVNKSGSDLLAVTGQNDYSGGTTITEGYLAVGSSTAFGSGPVVNNGGTLETYANQHVINVATNYTQAAGGTLLINLNADQPMAAANDVLNVAGTASLNGSLDIHFGFLPRQYDTFVVVTSGGGITTLGPGFVTPTVVNQAGILVTGSLSDVGDDLTLTVTQAQLQLTSALGGFATPNRSSITNALSSPTLAVTDPLLFANLVNLVTTASSSELPQLLANTADDFNPAKFGNFVQSTVVNNAVFSTQELDSYWESQRSSQGDFLVGNGQIDSSGLTVVDPTMDPGLAQVGSRLLAWSPSPIGHGLLSDSSDPVIAGFESTEAQPVTQSLSGHDFNTFVVGNVVLAQNFSQADVAHSNTTTGGIQIGADYRITPHLRAGIILGYNHTDASLDTNNSKATIDTYAPGAYVTFAENGWYANAVGSYGFSNYTEDRHVSFPGASAVAHGAPNGDQITGDIDGGYDFHVNNLTFGPLAGVQYTHLNVDAYSEDGAAALGSDLAVDNQKADSLRSRVGGHLSYVFKTGKVLLTPHLDASWQHEFMDQAEGITAQVGGVPFSVTTSRPSRDSALIDGGLNADLGGRTTLFLDYIVQAGQSNYFGQSVQVGVKIGF